MYKEIWNKNNCFIKLRNKDSENYDDKCMKIKFASIDSLSLREKVKMYNMVVIIMSIVYGNNKHYVVMF